MYQLLYVLRDVMQLRRGPQDVPYSQQLLLVLCAVTLLLQLALAYLRGGEGDTIAGGIIGLAFSLGVLYLLLHLRSLTNRFVQSATTLLGCAILFELLLVPLALTLPGHAPTVLTPLQVLAALFALLIVIWKLIVDAHILRHSLDLPFLAGLGIAVLWIIAELVLAAALGAVQPGAQG
jgi:hypothetical protein